MISEESAENNSEFPPDALVVQMDKQLPFEEVLKLLESNHDKDIHQYTCSSIHYGLQNWATAKYMSMRDNAGKVVRAVEDDFGTWEDFKLCAVTKNLYNEVPGEYALWSRQAGSLVTAKFNWGSATGSYDGNPYGELVAGGATQVDNWEIFRLKPVGVQGYALSYYIQGTQYWVSARYDYTGDNWGMVRAGVVATLGGGGWVGDDIWEHWLFVAH
jgi:hypothetical protein